MRLRGQHAERVRIGLRLRLVQDTVEMFIVSLVTRAPPLLAQRFCPDIVFAGYSGQNVICCPECILNGGYSVECLGAGERELAAGFPGSLDSADKQVSFAVSFGVQCEFGFWSPRLSSKRRTEYIIRL